MKGGGGGFGPLSPLSAAPEAMVCDFCDKINAEMGVFWLCKALTDEMYDAMPSIGVSLRKY